MWRLPARVGWRAAILALSIFATGVVGSMAQEDPTSATTRCDPSGLAPGAVIPNCYLVSLYPNQDVESIARDLAQQYGFTVVQLVPAIGVFQAHIPPEAVGAVRADARVRAVDEDRVDSVAGG